MVAKRAELPGVLGTNVAAMGILMGSTMAMGQTAGSGIVSIEVETRPNLGQRQVLPKPENWNMMTKGQQRYWYKHKSD